MHYEEMLTWLLFYTSLLDLEKTPRAGRARSRRAGEEPGGASRPTAALRIVLNGSQTSARSPRASCPRLFGSGVQHIAFATDDSSRPCAARGNGVTLLAIPENYYDDLEAKTDLPPEHRPR